MQKIPFLYMFWMLFTADFDIIKLLSSDDFIREKEVDI